MDVPEARLPDLFDEHGTIICDRTCRRCGYNLRGLREDGRCPECGTPIGLSTRGDLLRFADPAWVEKLALGIKYMLWGIVVVIAVSLLGYCIAHAVSGRDEIGDVVSLLAGLLGLYGAWLVTTPDPSGIGEDRYITARRVVRLCLLIGLLHECLIIVISVVESNSPLVVVFLVVPMVLCGLVSVAGEFAKLLYLEKLADRVPDPKLAGFAHFLRWAYCIGLAGAVIFGGLMAVGFATVGGAVAGPGVQPSATGPATTMSVTLGGLPFGATPGLFAALAAGSCVFGVAALVFGIMVIVLYVRCGRRFREQARRARRTWARATSPTATPLPPTPPASPTT